ncbi:MAG: diacylglycerol kinase family protein [Gemmatimonadota bacterium]
MTPRYQAIINGNAGGMASPDARETLTGLLTAAFPCCQLVFPAEGDDVSALAKEAVAQGAVMVIAGGGDGTINAVASGLVHSECILGVLPLGTLNHFARDLKIPLELEPAVEVLSGGVVINVDTGSVNDRVFLNNSGLGLYPIVVELREGQQERGWSKWPAAAWATLKALARFPRLSLTVTVAGKKIVRTTPIVFVGNNEYVLDGVQVPSRATLTNGVLCLYIPHPTGPFKLLWFSVRALFGRPRTGEDFDAMLVTECVIESRHRQLSISIDGEVVRLATPLRYQVQPGALRVMAPRGAD